MSIRFNVATERKSQLISRCLDSVGSKMGTEPVTNQKSHWLKKCTKTINLFFCALLHLSSKNSLFSFPLFKMPFCSLCCRMLQAVAQNHLYSVKTEDLSETLPTIQDIQQSYTKFKQFFLIGEFLIHKSQFLVLEGKKKHLNVHSRSMCICFYR